MTKQTAVEWFFNQLPEKTQANNEKEYWQAKAMEKEQIVNAYDCAFFGHGIDGKPCTSGGKYYNETYGN